MLDMVITSRIQLSNRKLWPTKKYVVLEILSISKPSYTIIIKYRSAVIFILY